MRSYALASRYCLWALQPLLPWIVAGNVRRMVNVFHGLQLEDHLLDMNPRLGALILVQDTTEGSVCLNSSLQVQRSLEQDVDMPSRAELFLGSFDFHRGLNEIWWKWKDDGNVVRHNPIQAFGLTRCPSFVFVPPALRTPNLSQADMMRAVPGIASTWQGLEEEVSWRQWVRHVLQRKLTVVNAMQFPVYVHVKYRSGNEYDTEIGDVSAMDVGEERVLDVPLGGVIEGWRVEENGEGQPHIGVFFLKIIPSDASRLIIDTFAENTSEALVSFSAEWFRLEEEAKMLKERDHSIATQHVQMLRQPPVLPAREIAPSYELFEIPTHLFERLLNFYRLYEDRREIEGVPEHSTTINAHEVNTTLVSLMNDWQERDRMMHEIILPLIESWVDMPLAISSMYGIREYYNGSYLRMHVDRLPTHIFSIIFNLLQSGMEEDWLLEVVDFDGIRKQVNMHPGQMLFYQSGKLIHGRPKPLRGERYVNCYGHFRPADSWKIDVSEDNMFVQDGEVLANFNPY
eukprot:TRINITY_DN33620_c0_g2_i1.p1 TRINITY_DN33620_c0_g2~~TRINITY_DN33620_c0_g2_i1.p1  ORF type:complete len:514 (-),score=83.31 TRINITY_DN33620_c0_g2_i1:30-1571(-)